MERDVSFINPLITPSPSLTVPSGKPTITAAHNTSSTSIRLSWRAPHPSTIHGEFLGYRIAFRFIFYMTFSSCFVDREQSKKKSPMVYLLLIIF